ncbi:unnamed protein product [Danaus chrysippus]|uniref:(African queen) hypothetical protein n=1 Tax=Danaus chrysippus TaxID=151541 RepID=A0A8J2MEE7_9NEOP|nr:unnamed protein product [Danaus chrysippus]
MQVSPSIASRLTTAESLDCLFRHHRLPLHTTSTLAAAIHCEYTYKADSQSRAHPIMGYPEVRRSEIRDPARRTNVWSNG